MPAFVLSDFHDICGDLANMGVRDKAPEDPTDFDFGWLSREQDFWQREENTFDRSDPYRRVPTRLANLAFEDTLNLYTSTPTTHPRWLPGASNHLATSRLTRHLSSLTHRILLKGDANDALKAYAYLEVDNDGFLLLENTGDPTLQHPFDLPPQPTNDQERHWYRSEELGLYLAVTNPSDGPMHTRAYMSANHLRTKLPED